MEPTMMTGAEVAELLRLSRDTVYRFAACGELAAHKIGRVWRFPRGAIEKYTRTMPRPFRGDTESQRKPISTGADVSEPKDATASRLSEIANAQGDED